jgi:hypothetical protein
MIRLGLFKHYKGGLYFVLGVAKHSEIADQELVVYFNLEHKQMWVRPYSMFLDEVEVNGVKVQRFQPLEAVNEPSHNPSK